MMTRIGVDELHRDTCAIAAFARTSFKDIPSTQFLSDLLCLNGIVLVGIRSCEKSPEMCAKRTARFGPASPESVAPGNSKLRAC